MNPPLILVVDDDIDYLTQQQVLLESAGFEVKTADCEEGALTALEEEKPDLVILDLMMENEDSGFSLSHAVKKKDKSIPVILITGVARETGLSFSAGHHWVKADRVLNKPVRFEQLKGQIAELLDKK